MEPHESAAIVRGFMRVGMEEKGWQVLEEELRIPFEGIQDEKLPLILKHRARSLASIASRHFHGAHPSAAAHALRKLGELGHSVSKSHMAEAELDVPWSRLLTAAGACQQKLAGKGKQDDSNLSSDLSELVLDAMFSFPYGRDESLVN